MTGICLCGFIILLTGRYICDGYILNDNNLPQFASYGKSMVLVGGNLADNNTEVYNTIVQTAVSRTSILDRPFENVL